MQFAFSLYLVKLQRESVANMLLNNSPRLLFLKLWFTLASCHGELPARELEDEETWESHFIDYCSKSMTLLAIAFEHQYSIVI